MELDSNHSIKDTLTRAKGEEGVEVYLRGGQSLKGVVLGVGDHHAIIGYLDGRDFFDSQIRLEEISAVILQTRTS